MSSEAALVVKVTLVLYSEAALNAWRGLVRNWPVLLGALGAFLAFLFLATILSPLGIAGRFLLGIIGVLLLSMYYGWLGSTLEKDRISFKNLIHFDYELFSSVISVGFVLWIASVFFITSFAHPSAPRWVPACYSLGVFLIFNSLPEIIYQRRERSLQAFRSAFEFNRESWIEWLLPLFVLLLPLLLASYTLFLALLSGADVMLPIVTIHSGLNVIFADLPWAIRALAAFVVGHWFMLFRAHLFKDLSTGTRRRRIYQIKQRM